MEAFARQVLFDDATRRFYAVCAGCGLRVEGVALPLLCRGKRPLFPVRIAHAHAAERLARRFNRCHRCGQWVCDACYGEYICHACTAAQGLP